MKTTVIVETTVEVEIDESKFTPEFLEHFNKHFHHLCGVDEHIENLAIQKAGGWAPSHDSFIEGYGKLNDFGVKLKTVDTIAFIEG